MKKISLLLALTLGCTGLLSGEPATDRFATLKSKVDALLNPRLNPVALPAKPANPFAFTPVGGEPTGPTDPVQPKPLPVPTTMTSDEQILAFCVSRLRITGQVLRNGVTHLLINSATYRESDLIPVRSTGDIVYYARIARIGDNEVTFSYNEASVNVRLP